MSGETVKRFVAGVVLMLLIGSLNAEAELRTIQSEDYVMEVWNTDSGLPDSTVTSIGQTPDGYLWVGTLTSGLARFDGVRFVNFNQVNTAPLEDPEVYQLQVDPEGTLWIGYVEGELFSYRQGRFWDEPIKMSPPGALLNGLVGCHAEHITMSTMGGWLIRSDRQAGTNRWQVLMPPDTETGTPFYEDSQGTIWYRTADAGLEQLKNGQFQRVTNFAGLASHQINTVAKDAAGRIWVGTEKELAVWDGNVFVNLTPTNGPAEIAVRQIAFCAGAGVWVRLDNRLSKCVGRKWTAKAVLQDGRFGPSARPIQMFCDQWGGVWISHHGGGLLHVDATGRADYLGEKEGLPNGLVECCFQDREGNVWAGLDRAGLVCLRKRTFHEVWAPGMVHNYFATSVCQDSKGAIWFGSSGDTFLEWYRNQFSAFAPSPDTIPGQDGIVYPDRDDRIWLGTVHNGVWYIEQGEFHRPFPAGDIGTVARVLYEDGGGRLWIGNEFGLYCWDHDELKHFSGSEGFAPGYVQSLAAGGPGELWIGMLDGELRLWSHERFIRYHFFDRKKTRFVALMPDRDGVVWIGTMGAGLLRFQGGKFTACKLNVGQPGEFISQILDDRNGQLWLGTRGGVVQVSKKNLEQFAAGGLKLVPCTIYGKFDGLPSVGCSAGGQPACWRDHEGRLWFSTERGAAWVKPDEIPYNPLPPPVHIEEIQVDGQTLSEAEWRNVNASTDPQAVKNELKVGAGRHYFEFRFTALSFVAPDKVRFRWRLEGMEANWVEGVDKRTVNYSFIPPGKYRLHVQACNNDGVWNEAGDTLALVVMPYFWQTMGFRVAASLGAVALLFLGYSVRISRIRALQQLRLRIARDLHDEVNSNISSITLLAQMMEKQPTKADATLIRTVSTQTGEILRDIVWLMQPKFDRVNDLVERMELVARAMLREMHYTFERRGDLATGSLPIEFRRHALPIFKEALHNVIKHSQATEVEIRVTRSGGWFEFYVRDNGQGMNGRGSFSGNGMKNMRRRAEEMGGRIEFDSSPGRGCTLRLRAPIP
jgi:ligand-binding sensor domain-containing protein